MKKISNGRGRGNFFRGAFSAHLPRGRLKDCGKGTLCRSHKLANYVDITLQGGCSRIVGIVD